MNRAPDHIVSDLARKVGDEVASRIKLTASLLSDPSEQLAVALMAAGSAIGWAAGFADIKLRTKGDNMSPDEAVDLMWNLLRPIALTTMGGDDADLRELLRHCRA